MSEKQRPAMVLLVGQEESCCAARSHSSQQTADPPLAPSDEWMIECLLSSSQRCCGVARSGAVAPTRPEPAI